MHNLVIVYSTMTISERARVLKALLVTKLESHRSLKKNLMADLMRPYETFGQILCPISMTFKVSLKAEKMSHICRHIWWHLTTFKETLKVITRWTLRKPKVTYMWHIWRHTCDIYMTFKVTLKVTLQYCLCHINVNIYVDIYVT